MRLLRKLFKPEIVVVEIPNRRLDPISKEDEIAIANLKGHPGFQALCRRLRIQMAFLESQLKNKRHARIREVDNLQNGLAWLGYLEAECDRSLEKTRRPVAVPTEDELDLFNRIYANIERVE